MPVTKVRSKWVSGDLVFETLTGTEIIRILGDGTFKVNEILLDAATLDELALLGGLTASVAELNLLDGSVAGTAVASKAAALGANKELDVLAVADLKLGAGAGTSVSSTAAELNLLDGSIAGTAVASKALVLGANKNVDILAVADGGLALGAGAGTAITATAAELNILDGATVTVGELNSLDDSAAFADGLSRVRVATATYDFAVDGGAISAIDLGG